MCGIAGFFSYKTKFPVDHRRLTDVLESMRYRGPDGIGLYKDNDIAIGNVRLAIQDVTNIGNQPIYNEDKSIVVVYNGEIYNFQEIRSLLEQKKHVFYTRTDTEILVHAYEEFGLDMANQFNGMFAFALFDTKKRMLVLGRDRTAQKPLFLHRNKNGIFFASEIKAMLPHLDNRSLNIESVRTFLSIGYTLEPQTILNEIESLEPGTIHAFSYHGEQVKKFWQVQNKAPRHFNNLNEWEEEADQVLRNAVKRHLVSDVPIALCLSGGVDSGLLALYLKEEHKIHKAFTGSFIGFDDHDEYSVANKLGTYCGFKPERISLSNSVLAGNLNDFLEHSSQPQGDYSGLATFSMAKEIAKEYKVVLGGDGGDEVFGGYPTYTLPYLSRKYGFISPGFISFAHRLLSVLVDKRKYLSYSFQLQQLSLAWGKDAGSAHFMVTNFLPFALSAELLGYNFSANAMNKNAAESVFKDFYCDGLFSDPVQKLCWVDFNTFLRSATIPKVERNSMFWSLEARLPYLDNEVLNLGFSMDSALKVQGRETKKALKSLLKNKVQGKVDFIPIKHGFSPPLVALFENELKDWKESGLRMKNSFLKPTTNQILSKWHKKGWDLHRLEWNICVLNDWCYRNNIK